MVNNKQADLFQSTAPLHPQTLSGQQRVDWLRLIRSPNIGPITFRDLINHFGSASVALSALEGRKFNGKHFQISSKDAALREIEMAEKFNASIVALGEKTYPKWLQSIDSAPPLLYIKGHSELGCRPSVGIVGSRNASGAGLKFAAQLARDLNEQGFVITSGLARGIDAAAHSASLYHGTIAVLGGGLDHIYPAQNEEIYHRVASEGLLVSERPLGVYAKAKDFPRRNRLISGISHGTIIVEAAVRSGSLTTARFASEQGREVFAVPGHPLDPRANGTNRLIQDGATLITNAQDVIDALQPQIKSEASDLKLQGFREDFERDDTTLSSSTTLTDYESGTVDLKQSVLEILGTTPIERDVLVRLLKCTAKELQIVLLELDLEGCIEHHGQQKLSLKQG
ncbi:DNA-processing protein DprA [Hyphomicrobiales bacterium 4NK60-0047b]